MADVTTSENRDIIVGISPNMAFNQNSTLIAPIAASALSNSQVGNVMKNKVDPLEKAVFSHENNLIFR
jgi:hypothetical protein